MSVDREAIYAALFARFQTKLLTANGGPFVTVGRRHRMPPKELTAVEQPALFVCAVQENRNPRPGGTGGKLTLRAMLFVYAFQQPTNESAGAETQLAESEMHTLLKAIDDALAPDTAASPFAWAPQSAQTLGGLAAHVWIEGDSDIDPAIFGPQAVAVVPLQILCP